MIDLKLGDCLEIMKIMKDNSIDVSFTSPPYNSIRHKEYKNYTDDLKNYYLFLCKFTDELLRITKKTIIINLQANYYNKADVYKYIGNYCDKITRIVIWNKSNPTPARKNRLTNSYEYFLIFSKEHNVVINSIFMRDVIDFPINSQKIKEHKAVMNNDVADLFIREFTDEKDTILDCFMGSGTTGLSCKKYNRNFIGIEIDEEYFNLAKNRIESLENQSTIFDYLGGE